MDSESLQLITSTLTLLFESEQIWEIRVLKVDGKKNRTDSGYFSDPEAAAKAAVRYLNRAEGIYFTPNPVNPALLARANNRMQEYASHTTSDSDVLQRQWLFIDVDPVRPAGISSTDEEHELALQHAQNCRAWLSSLGWPRPIFADSGNGAHLLYRIDLPNDATSTDLIQRILETLSAHFSNEQVLIDTSVYNAARIWKLYGTFARKGENMPSRPHRRAAILEAPCSMS